MEKEKDNDSVKVRKRGSVLNQKPSHIFNSHCLVNGQVGWVNFNDDLLTK